MKKTFIMAAACMVLSCCTVKHYEPSEASETENTIEPVDSSLVSRNYSEYDQKTTVSYAGDIKKSDCTLMATYTISETDRLKNKLAEPLTDEFRLAVIAHKDGATSIDRIEVTADTTYTLRPNHTESEGKGTFTLLVNISCMNRNLGVEKMLGTADAADVKVVYDNGSETYKLAKDDLLPFSTMYRSYLLDGGVFD